MSGRRWFQEHYPQGIVWGYDVDKPFKLLSWASEFIEISYLSIHYRIPHKIDRQPTIRKAE